MILACCLQDLVKLKGSRRDGPGGSATFKASKGSDTVTVALTVAQTQRLTLTVTTKAKWHTQTKNTRDPETKA